MLVACSIAFGQYPYPGGGYPYPGTYPGTYPPGSYPPGTYPGGAGTGVPIPSRGSTSKPTNNAPLPNFRGKMKQMDDKTITLTMDDHRDIQFRRNSKTKFFKGGDEVKTPKFTVGDQLSIEGQEDPTGAFTAVNVYWERGARPAGTETASDTKPGGSTPDVWKDDAKPGTPAPAPAAPPVGQPPRSPDPNDNAGAPYPSASAPPAPQTPRSPDPRDNAGASYPSPSSSGQAASSPDPNDDPGPPKLVRGGVSDPSRERAAPVPDDAVTTPPPAPRSTPVDDGGTAPSTNSLGNPSVLRGDEDPTVRRLAGDPLIAKTMEAALDFTAGLPNYVCQEMMARYQSSTRPANWQAIDVVTTALVYDNGKEDYRDITINGRPFRKGMDQMDGSWSTGEFGTMLIDLLAPATNAQFHYRHDDRAGGIPTKVYDYNVQRQNSHWMITMGSQTYSPAYKGSIWIDPSNGRVMRIEMQAYGFPADFPTDDVESAMDYQYTRLGDAQQYLLPVHAETLSCQRGTDLCSHNVIDFRNYHKYTGESNITFGDTVKK